MKKILIFGWLIVAFLGVLTYALPARAASPIFTLTYPGQPGPLFTESNWAPLDSIVKPISVTNNSDATQQFALNLQSLIGVPNSQLAAVLTLEVSRSANILYTNHLSDLENKETFIEDIPGSITYTYDIKITMDDVGNEYQKSEVKFDFILGFLAPAATHGGGGPQEILGDSASVSDGVEELPQTGQDALSSLMVVFLMIVISAVIFTGLRFFRFKR